MVFLTAKVAIIISTFNRVNLLKKTLESLHQNLRNTNSDVAVYIFNDGSTDGTREFLDSIANENNYRIINNPTNEGLRVGLNYLLSTVYDHFKPDYISYNQDDVEFKEGWLAKCIDFWEEYKKDIGFVTCHDAPEHPTVCGGRLFNTSFLFKRTCRATHLFASTERWKGFGVIPDLTPGIAAPKPGQGSKVDWWLVGHPTGKYPESEHSLKKDGEFVLVIPGYVKHIGVSESTWGNYFNPESESR